MCIIIASLFSLCFYINPIHISFSVFLQRWLTHSRVRRHLMPATPFIRRSSMLKCILSLSVRVLLFMLLVVAGDVERNPGPLSKEGTTCALLCSPRFHV